MSLHWLGNATDLGVLTAKDRTCDICQAPPGEWCRPPITPGHLVHLGRTNTGRDNKRCQPQDDTNPGSG